MIDAHNQASSLIHGGTYLPISLILVYVFKNIGVYGVCCYFFYFVLHIQLQTEFE